MFICSWKWHSIWLFAPLFLVIWLFHWHLLPAPSKLTSWPSPTSLGLPRFFDHPLLFLVTLRCQLCWLIFLFSRPKYRHFNLVPFSSPSLHSCGREVHLYPYFQGVLDRWHPDRLSQPKLLPYISNPHWLFLPFVAAHLKNSEIWTGQKPLPLENPQVITHKR